MASNSNLKKHLTSSHAATKIVAKNRENVSSVTKGGDGATTSKQLKLKLVHCSVLYREHYLLNCFVRKKILQVSYSMSTVSIVKLCDSFIILICTTKSVCIFISSIYLFLVYFLSIILYLDLFVGQLWSVQ